MHSKQRYVGLHGAKSLTGFKLCATTPNDTQQHATECENRRNTYHPTVLGVVGQQCCVRLHIALQLNFKNESASGAMKHSGVWQLLP